MTQRIKHNRFNEFGEVTEEFYVEYPDSNDTGTDIYLKRPLMVSIAGRSKKGDTFHSDYTAFEENVWYVNDAGEATQVDSMSGKNLGSIYEFTFGIHGSDKEITVTLNPEYGV